MLATTSTNDQVRAAVLRALTLDPAAGAHAAIAATAQALRLAPHEVANAAGLCSRCARTPHTFDDPLCVPHEDSPMPLRAGGSIDPRCAWPFPSAFEVTA